jgi:hypothetical protein
VIVTKLLAIKTPFTKGNWNNCSANGENPFASEALVNSTDSPVNNKYLLATNFIVVGFGVISAYTFTGTCIFFRKLICATKLRIRFLNRFKEITS